MGLRVPFFLFFCFRGDCLPAEDTSKQEMIIKGILARSNEPCLQLVSELSRCRGIRRIVHCLNQLLRVQVHDALN